MSDRICRKLAQRDALSLDQNTAYTVKDVFVLFITNVLYTLYYFPQVAIC